MSAPVTKRRVRRWDPYLEPGEGDMEFRLTYEGRLLAHRDDDRLRERALHVHEIRKKFHKQLRNLWNKHRSLRDWDQGARDQWMFPHFVHYGFDWLPIVTRQNGLSCRLDIMMLRDGQPGNVIYDLENRVKTIFDALRKAKGPNELGLGTSKGQQGPEAEEAPFFVLLEDDNLITHVSVTSDTLLEEIPGVSKSEAVRLVIEVTVRPYNVHMENSGFV